MNGALRLCVMSLVIWCMGLASAGATPSQRVVSLNLCTDQLAATMLPRQRLLGLSIHARDPALSLVFATARSFPVVRGTVEEMLTLTPDLVLMGEGQNSILQQWLVERNVPVHLMGVSNSIAEVKRDIRRMGHVLGADMRADHLIKRMDNLFAQVKFTKPGVRVAIYYPRGFTDGQGTLIHDVVTRLGGVNVAAEQGIGEVGYLSIEEMVALRPDVLVVPLYDYDVTSQAEQILYHPALEKLNAAIVPIPGQYLTCPHLGLEAVINAISVAVN